MAGAAIEASLRAGRKLEFSAEELAAFLDRASGAAQSRRCRVAAAIGVGRPRRRPAHSGRVVAAICSRRCEQLGWHGTRPLRSDEQQTVNRWHALLDEYSALGPWLAPSTASEAVATLSDLASERNFDAASVEAPVTLTESHDDPLVRYDGIWVAGLDAAQWPSRATSRRVHSVAPAGRGGCSVGQRGCADPRRACSRSRRGVRARTNSSVRGRGSKAMHIASPSPLLVHLRERA